MLYEAKKRYGLVILNYVVTSNPIHLIVHGKDASEAIPKSILGVEKSDIEAKNHLALGCINHKISVLVWSDPVQRQNEGYKRVIGDIRWFVE
jgi:hypothetical protein